MTATNAAIIYDVAAMLIQPSTALRRIVICDTDSQVTDPNGPCALNAGEIMLLMPMTVYETLTSPAAIVTWVVANK